MVEDGRNADVVTNFVFLITLVVCDVLCYKDIRRRSIIVICKTITERLTTSWKDTESMLKQNETCEGRGIPNCTLYTWSGRRETSKSKDINQSINALYSGIAHPYTNYVITQLCDTNKAKQTSMHVHIAYASNAGAMGKCIMRTLPKCCVGLYCMTSL